MNFNPSNVWSWYQQRPQWQKVIFFVFVILLIIIAAGVVYFMRGRILSSITDDGPDPLQISKDAIEEHFWGEYRNAEKKDTEAAGRIIDERSKRKQLKREREDAADENENDHDDIDAADSIADVDATLRNRRRR